MVLALASDVVLDPANPVRRHRERSVSALPAEQETLVTRVVTRCDDAPLHCFITPANETEGGSLTSR